MLFVVIAFIVCIMPDVQRCRRQHKCSDNNICRVLCVVFDDDNTCYVDNEPLCASARALKFGNDGKECYLSLVRKRTSYPLAIVHKRTGY